jgi:hypothetical protein
MNGESAAAGNWFIESRADAPPNGILWQGAVPLPGEAPAARIAADAAAGRNAVPVGVESARMLRVNGPGILVPHERLHHAEHVPHARVNDFIAVSKKHVINVDVWSSISASTPESRKRTDEAFSAASAAIEKDIFTR